MSNGELEAVVGEADVGRERGVGGGVVQVVAHVGEEGAARLELFDEGDRLGEVRVGGVGSRRSASRMRTSRSGEEGRLLGGDVAEVGEVGGGAETVAGDGLAAMGDGDALEAGTEEVYFRAGCGVRRWRRDAGAVG